MKSKNNYTKDDILDLIKELSLYEKIILKVHRKLFTKVYKLGITFGFNNK